LSDANLPSRALPARTGDDGPHRLVSRALVAVTLALLLPGCGGVPAVTFRLVPASDLVVAPEFVRLVFRPSGADAIETEPGSTSSLPTNAFVGIIPGTTFSIDVIGCKNNVADDCQTEDTFVARGCKGGLVQSPDEPLEVEVEVHGAVVGNPLCPVEDPTK
jgi:hypothetical protein